MLHFLTLIGLGGRTCYVSSDFVYIHSSFFEDSLCPSNVLWFHAYPSLTVADGVLSGKSRV